MKFLRRIIQACIVLVVLLAPSRSEALTSLGGYTFERFRETIAVQLDGSLNVREEISVNFYEPHHGIFRNIPVRYRTDRGNRTSIGIEIEEVLQNGAFIPHSIDREGDDLVVKIGDPGRYVNGDVTYTIAYRVDRALLHFDDHDELYWNATGSAWDTAPKDVDVRVTLPNEIPASSIRTACYTGAHGSTATDCDSSVTDRTAHFTSHDFLTVVVGFAPGIVATPSTWDRVVQFILDNWLALLPLLVLLGLFTYWWHHGRDPKLQAIVTQFEPPEHLRPGEVGVLIDGKVHDRDLSATIVDLAVRGYLKIIEREEKGIFGAKRLFTLERTGKSTDDLQEYEREILTGVFGTAMKRDLETMQSRASEMATRRKKASDLLYKMLAERKWFVKNPEVVRNAFLFIGIAGIFGTFFIGLPFAISIAFISSSALVALFGFIMPKRTEEGTRIFEHALGFKTYLERAEEYRLKWQEQQNVFEAFLPYAMVFGVVDKWTNALQSVISQPDWYSSSTPGVWNFIYFNAAMTDFNRSLTSAVAVTPQKGAAGGGSGFSGGFSGGGFGGGGGGSW